MDFKLLGFIVYLVVIFIVGFITYRINKSHEDFFLAGRKLNPWVVAFSERASGESSWLLLGLPGAALAVGFLEFWTALGCILGIIFSWYFIAHDLRVETERYDSITLPTFFAEKFGKYSNSIRVISTLIIIFFFTFYLGAQFVGAGKVLKVTFGIEEGIGIAIGAVAIIFYTMMGGFVAVVWTDLIQGIIMIGTLIILPVAGIIELAESGTSISAAVGEAGAMHNSFVGGVAGIAAAAIVINGLSWGLGYMGQPHLLTRFMAIGDPEKIKTSRRIAIAWAIPAFFGAMLIGLIGLGMFGQEHFLDVEYVMPELAGILLPDWLAGIFISGAIAAMMSTADSQLLLISSSFVEDFYHKTLGKSPGQKTLLNISRAITIIVGIAGFLIAYTSDELIFELVSYSWAGLGASFGPALLLTLKWKRTTAEGVLAGMISGSVATIIINNVDALSSTLSVRFTAFLFAFIQVVLVSLVTQKHDHTVKDSL